MNASTVSSSEGTPTKPPPPTPPGLETIPNAGVGPQLKPWAGMGGLVLAAAAVRAAQHLTGADKSIALGVAVTAFVVVVVWATGRGRRIADRRLRHRGYQFAATCAGWLTSVAYTGLSVNAVGLLAMVGAALSLSWWQAKRIPNIPSVAYAPTAAPAARGAFEVRWADNVAAANCALPGSRLESPEPIKAGVRYVLRLRPGQQTYGMVLGLLERIRGGLQLERDQDMIVERHPVLAEPTLLLTIVTRSPIKESIVWPGPTAFDPATGRVNLGPFVDGEGVASWRAYTDNRLWGGYIQGGTGSGKSRLIDSIALSLAAAQSHPTVVWYGDGQGGASSPLLKRHADHVALTHDNIHAMLAGVLLIIGLRQDENVMDDLEGFTPTADRPGLVVIIDECHKPLSKIENPDLADVTQWMIATIAREGGKVGVAIILASQQSTLDAFGGAGNNAAETIRSNLLAGNGVILRSKDANAKQVFKVDVDPSKFPPLAGYGFIVDPDPNGRTAPYRGYFVTDDARAYWPGRIEWRELDPAAANTYGSPYLHRKTLAAEAKEEVRRRVEARRAGRPVPGGGSRLGVPTRDEVVAAQVQVAQFPVWVHPESAPRPLHDGHRKVMDALAAGHIGPKAIQDATGYSERQVHNLLGDLVGREMVSRDGFGRYRLLHVDEEAAA